MPNKKAVGEWHWYGLIAVFFVSIGIVAFLQLTQTPIPKVGEYSADIIKTLEKHSITPTIIENILEEINEQSVEKLNEYEAFLAQFESYCNKQYVDSLDTKGRTFQTKDYGLSSCHVNEFSLIQKFRWIFNKKYNELQLQEFGNIGIDFSGVEYRAYVKKENEIFFSETRPDGRFKMPINTEKKQIGEFYMKPSFKFPVDYDFDNPTKERCIFFKGCATYDELLERHADLTLEPYLYTTKKEICGYYDGCDEVHGTDIDYRGDAYKDYRPGGKSLCAGACTPPDCLSDDVSKTKSKSPTQCLDYSCGSYYSCSIATECSCPDTLNACIGSCPSCWCPVWNYGTECGEAECGETEVLKTRACMPAGCDTERECEYKAECVHA